MGFKNQLQMQPYGEAFPSRSSYPRRVQSELGLLDAGRSKATCSCCQVQSATTPRLIAWGDLQRSPHFCDGYIVPAFSLADLLTGNGNPRHSGDVQPAVTKAAAEMDRKIDTELSSTRYRQNRCPHVWESTHADMSRLDNARGCSRDKPLPEFLFDVCTLLEIRRTRLTELAHEPAGHCCGRRIGMEGYDGDAQPQILKDFAKLLVARMKTQLRVFVYDQDAVPFE